jgi:hypothetical protein
LSPDFDYHDSVDNDADKKYPVHDHHAYACSFCAFH